MKKWMILIGVLCAATTSCLDSWDKAPAPTPDTPCGSGQACQDGNPLQPTGTCCSQQDVCGGSFPNVGCDVGWCCADDSEFYIDPIVGHVRRGDGGVRADGGTRYRHTVRQWKAKP
jgi:hypothetical protein